MLEALQSLLDTERFCYAECVPTTEDRHKNYRSFLPSADDARGLALKTNPWLDSQLSSSNHAGLAAYYADNFEFVVANFAGP